MVILCCFCWYVENFYTHVGIPYTHWAVLRTVLMLDARLPLVGRLLHNGHGWASAAGGGGRGIAGIDGPRNWVEGMPYSIRCHR